MRKAKTIALLLLAMVAIAALGCVGDKDNKDIESYKPSEAPEGFQESYFSVFGAGDERIKENEELREAGAKKIMYVFYTENENILGDIRLSVFEFGREENAQKLYEKYVSTCDFAHHDDRFIITVAYESEYREEAEMLFKQVCQA